MSSGTWKKGVAFLCVLGGCSLPATVPTEAPAPRAPVSAPTPVEAPPPAPPPMEPPRIVKRPPAPDPFAAFPKTYRAKALSEERQGNLRIALLHWRVVRAFLPEDPEATERVAALEREIQVRADGHLQQGKEKYREGKYGDARREFLAVLAYDPFLDEAADYLKYRLTRPDSRSYVTKEGDTPKSIAQDIYKDAGKDYLVAYFNSVERGASFRPGTQLTLPLLDLSASGINQAPKRAQRSASLPGVARAPISPPASPEDSLDRARTAFRAGDFRKAATFAEEALQRSPANREARELLNASCYKLGADYFRRREYTEALRMFRKVEGSYKDQKEMVARLESRMKEQAEKHYAAGQKRFVAEDLDGAVREWEATLQLDPTHGMARRDIERARRMLEQVKSVE
jgi:tetratricopeptide (TPR) repeat protein